MEQLVIKLTESLFNLNPSPETDKIAQDIILKEIEALDDEDAINVLASALTLSVLTSIRLKKELCNGNC